MLQKYDISLVLFTRLTVIRTQEENLKTMFLRNLFTDSFISGMNFQEYFCCV